MNFFHSNQAIPLRYFHLRFSSTSTVKSPVTAKLSHPAARSGISSNSGKPLKKFWKNVQIVQNNDGIFNVQLDGRNIKTPFGNVLGLQSRVLAEMVSNEWDLQAKDETEKIIIKPHYFQITSLVCRSLDGLADDEERRGVLEKLGRYLDTDSLCFHVESPDTLVSMQREHWDPIIEDLKSHFQVDLKTTLGLLDIQQPQATKEKLFDHVSRYDTLKLAGFEKAVMYSKSYLIALALMERRISVEDAAVASRLESIAQSKIWGYVEDTHDVEEADMISQLGSAAAMLLHT